MPRYRRRTVSPRARVLVIAGVAAVGAASAAVGVALVQREDTPAAAARPSGEPPLALELGVRSDPEARDLRRGVRLYRAGRRAAAARIFGRHGSVEARVGSALARWPHGTLAALRRLERANPSRAVVRLHVGFALVWSGRREGAIAEWRAAARLEPDTPSAVRAGDLLHPNVAPGLPVFVTTFPPPPTLDRLGPARQLALLARNARRGGVREKLLYGVALQRLERPVSARRQFDGAVGLAPDDPEALTAAAVARFDKDRPRAAFARLGPLTRRFPHAPTVRFHLGLLLLWFGELEDARRQLRLARAAGPATPIGREAARFLRRLAIEG